MARSYRRALVLLPRPAQVGAGPLRNASAPTWEVELSLQQEYAHGARLGDGLWGRREGALVLLSMAVFKSTHEMKMPTA